MKINFTLLILFISLKSFCQSSIEYRDPVNQQGFETMLTLYNSSIQISKYKSSTLNEISLIFKTETNICGDNHGINLTLVSGEKLSFENAVIACEELETKKYKLSGSFILSPELYTKLSQTEILEFKLGDVIVPVYFKEKGENLRDLFKFSESY